MVSLRMMPCSIAKALEDTRRRVVLLTVNRSVIIQNTVDAIREGGQFRAFRWQRVADWQPAAQNVHHASLITVSRAYAKPTCRLSLAQTINMAGLPNAQI